MSETEIGRVTHYFNKIGVAAIELDKPIKVGDVIHIKGHTSDWKQEVLSMQVEHEEVQEAGPGDSVGLKVEGHAHEHDKVFKVED